MHRGQLRSVMHTSTTSTNAGGTTGGRNKGIGMPFVHFLRLLAMSLILSTYGLGFSIYQLFIALNNIQPWISWTNVHHRFSAIGQIPSVLMTPALQRSLWIFWSLYPSSALLFFVLFGLTSEAISDWEKTWKACSKWVVDKCIPKAWKAAVPPPVPQKDAKYR